MGISIFSYISRVFIYFHWIIFLITFKNPCQIIRAISMLVSVDCPSLFELMFDVWWIVFFLLYPGHFQYYYMKLRFLFKAHHWQTRVAIWSVFTQIISAENPWPGRYRTPVISLMLICDCAQGLPLTASVHAHWLRRKPSPYCHIGMVISLLTHKASIHANQPGERTILFTIQVKQKSEFCSLWAE